MAAAVPRKITKSQVFKGLVDPKLATEVYNNLIATVEWDEGVKSKGRHTRLAKMYEMDDDMVLTTFVLDAITKAGIKDDLIIEGMYLNYQRNGQEWTPNHSHAGSVQFIICLGPAIRTFNLAKKSYQVTNGDCLYFGSSIHGVPQEPEVKEGRISIATFSRRM
jgi:hypothetical protein